MKQITNTVFGVNEKIRNGRNYIFGAGNHADHMGKWFALHGMPCEGFVYVSGNRSVSEDKRVISLEEFKALDDANLLLTQNRWQEVYDNLCAEGVDRERIYVNTTWYRGETKCMMCDYDMTFATDAGFMPFLTERIFQGIKKETQIIHCPRCRCYYSSYRPTDAEMDALYAGYHGKEYLEQRNRYEPDYTAAFNRELCAPRDGGRERKSRIWNFVKPYLDRERVKTVLDFGGDQGQFMPDELADADRYVYEISGNEVIEGVTLLKKREELDKFVWDLILCNMVMEHLSEPREYFRELASYMSDHTLLYVEVPMERHMENSDFVPIHEHINFFREEVFRFWAQENHLKIVTARTSDIIQVLFQR